MTKNEEKQTRKVIYVHDDEPNELACRLFNMEKALNDGFFIENVYQTEKTIVFLLVKYG